MTIYTYGLFMPPIDGSNLDDATGLPFRFIAGCIISDEIVGKADGHNKTIEQYIDSNNL